MQLIISSLSFFSVEIPLRLQGHATNNTISIEFLLNMDFKVALMDVFSESSNLSLSHLNYITCYFLYYLLKTINTFSLLS